jgi:hypothetical protein
MIKHDLKHSRENHKYKTFTKITRLVLIKMVKKLYMSASLANIEILANADMNTTKEADAIVRLFCHSTQTRNFL